MPLRVGASIPLQHSSAVAKKRIKAREQARKASKPEAPQDTI